MNEVEISISPEYVLECLDERDIIDYYSFEDLFNAASEKEALKAIKENFTLSGDDIVDQIKCDITVEKILELYDSLDEKDKNENS